MSIKGKAYVMGAFEHPTREAPDKSVAQLHVECARGALEDAGLTKDDIDGYFCAGDAPGFGAMSMADYLGLRNLRHMDSTETGGSSYILHVGHAAEAIAAGKCSVALITLAGKPRTTQGGGGRPGGFAAAPESAFEMPYGGTTHNQYAMCATRHMHEFGTTSEQLAWIKVAASHHAQYNPNAFLKEVVTVEEVLASPMIATPLHRMDCCVVTDGGGALIVTSPDIAHSRSMISVAAPWRVPSEPPVPCAMARSQLGTCTLGCASPRSWRTASITLVMPPRLVGWLLQRPPPSVLNGSLPTPEIRLPSATNLPPSPFLQKPRSSSCISTVMVKLS